MGHRLLRINERIRESVSAAIVERVKDPRVGFVTVTGVETTPDLRRAKVFVSVLGSEKEREATLEALTQARGLLQASITTGLRMKRTPQIEFVHDPTPAHAQRIESLIRQEAAELEAREAAEPEAQTDEVEARVDEAEARADEVEAQVDEAEARADEASTDEEEAGP